ncbi:MAG: hypothetical protein AAFZ91_15250 [Pseudomonadota bacterium]
MTTFDISFFPRKLSKIDELHLPDHHHLNSQDHCYYLGEYTARAGYSHSPTNNLIINFKKPMNRRGGRQWVYKLKAIRKAAEVMSFALKDTDFESVSFVPIPPSKRKTDPEYDDRVAQTLRLAFGTRSDIIDALTIAESREAYHNDTNRCPSALTDNLVVDLDELGKAKRTIVLFDDVITTGCHFRAMKDEILSIAPDKTIYGVFLARRVPNSADFSSFFE